MHVFRRWAPAVLAVLPLAAAAPAHADKITIGSDLRAPAASSLNDKSRIEAHGADTAFWPATVNGQPVVLPEDGQIVSVTIKGTVFTEPGASAPADLFHIQTLMPTGNGTWMVPSPEIDPMGWGGTSGDFHLPIDQPQNLYTVTPENLCARKGWSVGFNNIGGFAYGGSLDAPPDLDAGGDARHYGSGAPFGIFGLVSTSSTYRFTANEATKNGNTFTVPTANQDAGAPVGTLMQGKELLMQVVVATGDDRSEPCGGPRRHEDGTLVQTAPDPSYMKIVSSGGKPQQPYVTKDRKFTTGVYCGGKANPTCAGTATLLIGKRVIAKAAFTIPAMSTGRIPMRLSKKDFKKLAKSRTKRLNATYVLTTAFGTYTSKLTLKR